MKRLGPENETGKNWCTNPMDNTKSQNERKGLSLWNEEDEELTDAQNEQILWWQHTNKHRLTQGMTDEQNTIMYTQNWNM